MLEVFCRGFDAHVRLRDGTDTVEFPTATRRLASKRFGAGSERKGPGVRAEAEPLVCSVVDQPSLERVSDELGARGEPELLLDVRAMRLDCAHG